MNVIEIKRKQGYTLTEKEIETVVGVHIANNKQYEPTLMQRFKVDTEDKLRVKILDMIMNRIHEGYIFYLIYMDGDLVGFNNHHLSTLRIQGQQYSAIEIGTTSILPQYQNRGMGTALYARIDEDALNTYRVDIVSRVTWSTNARQCHLYEKYGYKRYMIKIDHYGVEGIDSVSYFKVLSREE